MARVEDAEAEDASRPRKPTRKNGIKTYETLLGAVEKVLETKSARSLSIYDIAEAAGVPPASVYHFFPSPVAAVVALSEVFLEEVQTLLLEQIEAEAVREWRDLARIQSERMKQFYDSNRVARNVLAGVDYLFPVRQLDLAGNKRLAQIMLEQFAEHFVLPERDDLIEKFEVMVTIHSAITALSIVQYGEFTAKLEDDAYRASVNFLEDYVPRNLPRKATG
ncbi:TetR/AcrR family transcriptional regulator [Erythrobacter sp.]|uniref:TetR/AcrR family transcriptional regulator n=1 Tax=Erythrobacter sp. TaxID=1042 RepID=UPI001B04896E|nr:TetR/AcrR family transcriptional regulator [Erythrobacter sp.]MBO6527552.1 TetR/AcrR family transcriptional regulator [Erythrobacter sp.]MBO6530232.1 TetR/AcrR family transcriptional regulator [Erythrobacter sp.]